MVGRNDPETRRDGSGGQQVPTTLGHDEPRKYHSLHLQAQKPFCGIFESK